MKLLFASLLVLASAHSFAAPSLPISPAAPIEQCSSQMLYGPPSTLKTHTQLICHPNEFFIEYDIPTKDPIVVSYVLTPEHAVGCYPRVSRFKPDPALADQDSAHAADYKKSGYDIGHMANDDDFRWSAQSEADTNDFANAAPQLPGLNRIGWKMLEDQTRAWATERGHALQIYVGPVLDKGDQPLGVDAISIPMAFYKVEIDTVTHEVMAFLYPQAKTDEDPSTFLTSIAAVQKAAGVSLPMPAKPVFSTSVWPSMHKSNQKLKAEVCSIH